MNKFIFSLLFFNLMVAMEQHHQTTASPHEQTVVVNVDHPGQTQLNRQESEEGFSCSVKSRCLKQNRAILAAGGSAIAFVVMLIVHLLKC